MKVHFSFACISCPQISNTCTGINSTVTPSSVDIDDAEAGFLSSNFDTDDEGGPCRSAEEQDASKESSHEELCRSVKRMRLEQATLLHFPVQFTYICVLAMLCNTGLIYMLSLMSAAFCLNKLHV